jgi:hypothetical protein
MPSAGLGAPVRDGSPAVAVINSEHDMAEQLTSALCIAAGPVIVTDMDRAETPVFVSATDGAYRQSVLPDIPSWDMRLIAVR